MSQVAHQAGAYLSFHSVKWLHVGVVLFSPGWDASLLQGHHRFALTHLSTWVESGTVSIKCLAQEHNTASPTRAQTQTSQSREENTNPETTAP